MCNRTFYQVKGEHENTNCGKIESQSVKLSHLVNDRLKQHSFLISHLPHPKFGIPTLQIVFSLLIDSSVSSRIVSCRVFGFSPIIQNNCSYTWKLIVHPERKWYHFVNPIMLLILYYTLATLIRLWLQEPIDQMTVSTQMSDDARRFFPFGCAVMFAAKSISDSAIYARWREVNWSER